MSITTEVQVSQHRWRGSDVPALPIGSWVGAGIVTGDMSGGDLFVDLVFALASQTQRSSTLYSLEQVFIAATSSLVGPALLQVVNFDPDPAVNANWFFHIVMTNTEGTVSAALPSELAALRGLFLGSQRSPATETLLSLGMDNSDGQVLRFKAEGYMWSPRSITTEGGPQRPPSALYPG